ncbi:hypothetical protein BC351_00315 [Paenibacillus ferrarius]|uniref:BIG2 domain-containing protein n=1 Tax=Paenibacillus ferrarius TaxID=1469647 RepID=A0A1V4HS25_9BACL|nr:hypothetical protein [Paenibacillus ferrarius]OPH61720.1 hypothetical protein BC351_00315 [Paenibacillus ferrarius]
MTFYTAYNAKLSVTDANPRTYNINNTKRVITNSFKDSPSYYQVRVNTSSSPYTTSNLDSWIVDDSKTKELKQIQLIPDQLLHFGDVFTWQGEKWLTTSVDDMGGIYYRGAIQKCVSSLKWLDSLGAVKEAYFVQATENLRSLGLVDDKMMVLSNERRSIITQKNVDTLKIRKKQRFIFDEDRCWQVTGINSLNTNLITLELEETLLSSDKDNVQLRIADYYIHDYSIHISNGDSVNLRTNDTLQIEIEVKDQGSITSLPLSFTSSDSSVLSVTETGLITALSNGTANVRVSLTNNPDIFDDIQVLISDVVQSGWTLDISGSDFCKITQAQKFRGEVKNNGVTDTSKLIRWTLYDDSGTQPTTLGVIISQSGHDVSILANKKYTGYVKIKGVCYESTNFTVEDLATFTIEELSKLNVNQLTDVGFTADDVANYSVEELSVRTVDELFSLGLTIEQISSFTVGDLASYTVGELANEKVLVSAMKRIQIKSLI